jgi:2-haloacid dehalogenase
MTVQGVLLDLLMAVMNSLETWKSAAGDLGQGLLWRDAVTARMVAAGRYAPYENLVADAAAALGLPQSAPNELLNRWPQMEPWPDAAALHWLSVPYGFVTNTSTTLAQIAAGRSGLLPQFTMSAEDAGWFKPAPEIYRAACEKLGLEPERTMFVAGSPYDAAGARAAGLQPWLVLRRPDHRAPEAGIPTARSLDVIVTRIARDGSGTERGGRLPRSRAD